MKHLILAVLLTACGTDESREIVTYSDPTGTVTTPSSPDIPSIPDVDIPSTTFADDPDGRPEFGEVISYREGYKKFQLAEAECSDNSCTVRIKVERKCSGNGIVLFGFELRDGVMRSVNENILQVPADWRDGNVVTIQLQNEPFIKPCDSQCLGYQNQSGVFYGCP